MKTKKIIGHLFLITLLVSCSEDEQMIFDTINIDNQKNIPHNFSKVANRVESITVQYNFTKEKRRGFRRRRRTPIDYGRVNSILQNFRNLYPDIIEIKTFKTYPIYVQVWTLQNPNRIEKPNPTVDNGAQNQPEEDSDLTNPGNKPKTQFESLLLDIENNIDIDLY